MALERISPRLMGLCDVRGHLRRFRLGSYNSALQAGFAVLGMSESDRHAE